MRLLLSLSAALVLLPAPAAAQNQRPEFVIIAFGDSYASGEGDPEVPGSYAIDGVVGTAEIWTDTSDAAAFQDAWRCHRSPKSGAGRAVARLRETFPEIDFVFASFACSGAQAGVGMLQPFDGPEDRFMALPPLPPQIDQAAQYLGTRPHGRVDAVVMNIGGNDAGFGKIIEHCLSTAFLNGCDQNPDTRALVEDGIAALGGTNGRYAQIDTRLRQRLAPGRIYITEVPNPTRGSDGQICDHQPVGDLLLNRASRAEGQFIETVVVGGLNRAFREAADRHGWHVIGGIASDFRTHGICSSSSWFRDNGTALRIQGPEALAFGVSTEQLRLEVGLISSGFLHPNSGGYQAIGSRIAAALEQQVRERFTVAGRPQLRVDSVIQARPMMASTASRVRRVIGQERSMPGAIVLGWTDPAPGVTTKFVLTVNGEEIEKPATTTRHVVRIDGRVTARVRACGPLGCGAVSNEVSATNLVPGVPTELRKVASPGGTQWAGVIRLSWVPADENEERFEVRWKPESGTATVTAARSASGTRTIERTGGTAGRISMSGERTARTEEPSYQLGSPQAPLPAGTSYEIAVRACSSAGCSDWSAPITAAPGASGTVAMPRR